MFGEKNESQPPDIGLSIDRGIRSSWIVGEGTRECGGDHVHAQSCRRNATANAESPARWTRAAPESGSCGLDVGIGAGRAGTRQSARLGAVPQPIPYARTHDRLAVGVHHAADAVGVAPRRAAGDRRGRWRPARRGRPPHHRTAGRRPVDCAGGLRRWKRWWSTSTTISRRCGNSSPKC